MPQVAKSEEQRTLESRIQRTRSLLSNMTSQLRSLRSRNKAQRERQRRQQAVEKNSKRSDQMFEGLLAEVEAEKAKAKMLKLELREQLVQQGLGNYVDDLDFEMAETKTKDAAANGVDKSAGSSTDKKPMQ